MDKRKPSGSKSKRGYQQLVFFIPRKQLYTRSHACCLFVPCYTCRNGHGHRQSGNDSRIHRYSSGIALPYRRCHLQPTPRRNRTADRSCGISQKRIGTKRPYPNKPTYATKCLSTKGYEYALVKGTVDRLDADLHEALSAYGNAVKIIEGPLMNGMNRVGKLFGEGKMFLPQVVKSAKAMKAAVAILQPEIEKHNAGTGENIQRPKVVLATAKGDVHDIGKNIVAVVMACNGYEIIDLGVMVPAETIVQRAIEEKADMIGLSGLITPSLDEMVHVAMELEKAGLDIPLLIGGATTSPLHTALKIAPVYHAPVVYMKDASLNAPVAARLMNLDLRSTFAEELESEYRELREKNKTKQVKTVSLEEAQKNKLNLWE